MFAEWNGRHLFLYNGLSQNAQRRVFVNCAALRFIMVNICNYQIFQCSCRIPHYSSGRFLKERTSEDHFIFYLWTFMNYGVA